MIGLNRMSEISSKNAPPLEYWRFRGYRASDLDQLCRELDDRVMALRIEFSGDGNLKASLTSNAWKRQQGHYPTIIKYFEKLVNEYGCADLKGTVLIWLEDGMWGHHGSISFKTPTLTFSRTINDPHSFLMPDPAFIGAKGYADEIKGNLEFARHLNWKDRKPISFWRGASSGIGIEGEESWIKTPRAKLCMLAKQLNDPSILDAKFTQLTNLADSPVKSILETIGLVGQYEPFPNFLKYKYLIDVDGYACAWKSFFLKMASQSVVLKIQGDYEQWYYGQILPWIHYIPVSRDMKELPELVSWLRQNDQKCMDIASNGSEVIRLITYEEEAEKMALLLREILKCQKD